MFRCLDRIRKSSSICRPWLLVSTSLFSHHGVQIRSAQSFASRLRSSSTEDRLSSQELSAFTHFALDIVKLPIGTISTEQWRYFEEAISLWYAKSEGPSSSGWALCHADKLLERLYYEAATGSAASSRQANSQDFAQAIHYMTQSWLDETKKQERFQLAIERAYEWWKRQALYQEHDPDILSAQFVELVNAWLRFNTPAATIQAVHLLLSSSAYFIVSNRGKILECFDKAISQSIAFGAISNASALCNHSEELQLEKEPSQLPFRSANDENIDSCAYTRDIKAVPRPLSSLSLKPLTLEDRVMKFFSNAQECDRSAVEAWAEFLRNLETTGSTSVMATATADSFFEYYVRINDPCEARKWLLNGSPDQYTRLLILWSSRDDPLAASRVEELLLALGEICSKGSDDLIPFVCKKELAERLCGGGDIDFWHTIIDALSRSPVVNCELLKIVSRNMAMYDIVSNETVILLLEILNKSWNLFDEMDRENILENISKCIECNKLSASCSNLVQLMASHDKNPSPSVFERLLRAFPVNADPAMVMNLLEMVRRHRKPISFEYYRSAVMTILNLKNKHRRKIDPIKRALEQLLISIQEGLGVDADALETLLLDILHYVTYVQYEADAREILQLAEGKLLSSSVATTSMPKFPIPLDCYRKVAVMSFVKNRPSDVEALFNKVRTYQNMGYTEMTPDGDFYNLYMHSLTREGPDRVDTQLELLEEIIHLYKACGDDRFKPQFIMFKGITTSLKANPTTENVERGLQVLDLMIELDIDIGDPFPFNNIMYLVLKSNSDRAFQDVMKIFNKMRKRGIEPDAYTLSDILQACATVKKPDRMDGLRVAQDTLSAIRAAGFSCPETYKLMFRALAHLSQLNVDATDVSTVVEDLFRLCREDGWLTDELISDPVVHSLLQTSSRLQ